MLKYLMLKKEAKDWLIRWILFLQEFDLEIQDKKDIESIVPNHLSRIPNATHNKVPINGDFSDEQLLLSLGNYD